MPSYKPQTMRALPSRNGVTWYYARPVVKSRIYTERTMPTDHPNMKEEARLPPCFHSASRMDDDKTHQVTAMASGQIGNESWNNGRKRPLA
jgi:hypothetical protein